MHSSNIVYAIHDFEAENEDEVTFQYGEPIVILEKDDQYLDGWWQGRNTLGQTGLFPMNYTSPEKPMIANSRLLSYGNSVYHHTRMSSGTSSATSSSDDGTNRSSQSTEDILNKTNNNNTTFGISHSSPIDWNMEEVVTWLESVGLEVVVDNFIDQDITGDVLLDLDHDALKELGIHAYGRRYKVLNAIKTLKSGEQATLNHRQSTNSYLAHSQYGSVTENKTTSISSLNSSVSSTTPRSAVPANLSIYRNSLSTTSRNAQPDSDPHLSCSYSDKSNVLGNPRTLFNKRSTFDNQASPSALLSDNMLHLTLYDNDSDLDYPVVAPAAATATAVQHTFPQYEGWIYKQSDRYKTWNKRWFVLDGTNLFYFKNPKDTRMKGIIHLRGYRVILEESSGMSATNRYQFRLYHDQERTFFFYTNSMLEMKNWAQALFKSTIQRDLCVPVVSSSTVDTVSLDIAQKMKPRPPSILMYSNKDKKNLHYRQDIKNDVLSSALVEELDETLLWMEDPSSQDDEEPFQKLIIRSYPSSVHQDHDNTTTQQPPQREPSYFFDTPNKDEQQDFYHHPYEKSLAPTSISVAASASGSNAAILYWVNSCLAPTTEIHDLSSSFRSGQVLIQLLETLSGQTIARGGGGSNSKNDAHVETSSMSMLDNIVDAFKFMNRQGIINNGYTIKDVFSGNEDKIVDMVLSIKIWSEEVDPLRI